MSEIPTFEPMKLPFAAAPCPCVKRHSPVPKNVDLHHVYPQSEQRRRHGALVDRETTALCKSGHDAVHWAIDRLLRGESVWLGNSHLQGVAEEGVRRITA